MLAVRHARAPFAARLVFLGDRDAARGARAARIGLAARYADFDRRGVRAAGRRRSRCGTSAVAAPRRARHARPDQRGGVARACSRRACDACATGAFARWSPAPVQKSVMQDAGLAFTGHTEFFAARTRHAARGHDAGRRRGGRAAARRAGHHAPRARGRAGGDHARGGRARRSRSSRASCSPRFGIAAPRIAVCGLNPHAGEGGHLGREEIDVDRAGDRTRRAPRASTSTARSPPTRCSSRDIARALRRDRRDVSRPGLAGAQGRELRRRRQRDARPAVRPHVGRPRHGARPRRRRRQARAPPIPGSLVAAVDLAHRRSPRMPPRLKRVSDCAGTPHASASARTSSSTRTTSRASSTRSIRARATTSSRSAPASPR